MGLMIGLVGIALFVLVGKSLTKGVDIKNIFTFISIAGLAIITIALISAVPPLIVIIWPLWYLGRSLIRGIYRNDSKSSYKSRSNNDSSKSRESNHNNSSESKGVIRSFIDLKKREAKLQKRFDDFEDDLEEELDNAEYIEKLRD